jgi:hypothetical protein
MPKSMSINFLFCLAQQKGMWLKGESVYGWRVKVFIFEFPESATRCSEVCLWEFYTIIQNGTFKWEQTTFIFIIKLIVRYDFIIQRKTLSHILSRALWRLTFVRIWGLNAHILHCAVFSKIAWTFPKSACSVHEPTNIYPQFCIYQCVWILCR